VEKPVPVSRGGIPLTTYVAIYYSLLSKKALLEILIMNQDKVGAIFFLLLSIVYGALAFDIPLMFGEEDQAFTARTLPFALAIAGIMISALILFLPSGDTAKKKNLFQIFGGLNWKPVIQLAGLMLLYGLTIRWLGFLISTSLFLLSGYWILGERRLKVLLFASVPVVVVFWFLMTKVLGVYLARGDIFFFLEEM
jgi:putative tricarboxylic transport membrane protein